MEALSARVDLLEKKVASLLQEASPPSPVSSFFDGQSSGYIPLSSPSNKRERIANIGRFRVTAKQSRKRRKRKTKRSTKVKRA